MELVKDNPKSFLKHLIEKFSKKKNEATESDHQVKEKAEEDNEGRETWGSFILLLNGLI